jgi:hypothetical protein
MCVGRFLVGEELNEERHYGNMAAIADVRGSVLSGALNRSSASKERGGFSLL